MSLFSEGDIFQKYGDFLMAKEEYEGISGYTLSTADSKKNSEGDLRSSLNPFQYIIWRCVKSGKAISKGKGLRKVSSGKTDCPFNLRLSYVKSKNFYKISKLNLSHNHLTPAGDNEDLLDSTVGKVLSMEMESVQIIEEGDDTEKDQVDRERYEHDEMQKNNKIEMMKDALDCEQEQKEDEGNHEDKIELTMKGVMDSAQDEEQEQKEDEGNHEDKMERVTMKGTVDNEQEQKIEDEENHKDKIEFALRKRSNLNLFSESLCADRWKSEKIYSYDVERKETEPIKDKSADISIHQITTPRKMSIGEKRRRLKIITDELIVIASEQTDIKFKRKLQTLEQLLHSWKNNKNAYLKNCRESEDVFEDVQESNKSLKDISLEGTVSLKKDLDITTDKIRIPQITKSVGHMKGASFCTIRYKRRRKSKNRIQAI